MPSPTFAALGATLAGGTTSPAPVPVPAGMASDQVACILLYIENDGALTWPSGFTAVAVAENNTSGLEHRTYLAWKRATGADSGNYDVDHPANAYRSGVAFRISGAVSTGDPFAPTPAVGATTANGTDTPGLSLTTTTADTLLIWLDAAWDGGGTWTPPTGFTEQRDAEEWSVNSLAKGAAGSTGNLTATHSSSSALTAILVAIASTSGGEGRRPNARNIHARAVQRAATW